MPVIRVMFGHIILHGQNVEWGCQIAQLVRLGYLSVKLSHLALTTITSQCNYTPLLQLWLACKCCCTGCFMKITIEPLTLQNTSTVSLQDASRIWLVYHRVPNGNRKPEKPGDLNFCLSRSRNSLEFVAKSETPGQNKKSSRKPY